METTKYQLSDLVTIKYGKNQKKVVAENGDVPIYGTGGLMGYATEALYDKASVLIGRKGSIEKVRYVDRPFWTVDTLFYTIVNEGIVIPKYLYYLISTMDMKQYNEGTTIPSLRTETLNRIELEIPSLEDQKKILGCLNPIDSKIINNEAINRNLEDQIASVFEELRNSVETRTVKVGDLTLTSNTGADAIQKAPIVEEDTGIRCVRVGDMTNNRPVHEWGFSKVEPDVFIQYQLHKDDIVVTRTATLGINRLITEDLKAVYNNGLIRISLDKTKANPLFVYRQLQLKDFENYIARINGESSTRPNMKMNYFLSYEFELPSIDEQSRIVDQITESYKLQQKLVVENMELAAIRDTLLPSLMSGELDVSELDI